MDSEPCVSPVNGYFLLDAPSRSPDAARASSLWLIIRIVTLFLALTETMVLHVPKLDGVLDLFGVSKWYLMVTFVYIFFWWPVSSIVTALVSGRFLHGAQDPGFVCAGLSRKVGQDRACGVSVVSFMFLGRASNLNSETL